MELGIVDMGANFVPDSENQIGIERDKWASLSPLKMLSAILNIIKKSDFDYLELGVPWINEESFPITLQDIKSVIEEGKLKVKAYCSLMPAEIKTVGPKFNYEKI